jgi:hypothetical protein
MYCLPTTWRGCKSDYWLIRFETWGFPQVLMPVM